MKRFPVTLVFRQYGDNGKPLPNGYVVEREAHDEDDVRSYVQELQKLGYELESAFSEEVSDGLG